MNFDLIAISILILGLLICECFGVFIGFSFRSSNELRKKCKFKFVKSYKGIYRLDTTTGEIVLITKNGELEIHKGKRFHSYVNSFDLVEINETHVLYDTSTGFCMILT